MGCGKNKVSGDGEGYTLLEMILVIGIIVILAAIGFGAYQTFVTTIQFNSASEGIISDLKATREFAMSGLYGDNWGVHYTNTGSQYYYDLFYTPTTFFSASTVTTTRIYLPAGISFKNPSSGAGSSTVMFTNTTGTTTTSSVSIGDNYNDSSTVNITPSGTIY
jgi:prepilin-type N-terminal cleavage/methylation domain-containing protein